MRIFANSNFKKLDNNYLFAQIAERVGEYTKNHANADIISLGVGDVTLPLADCVIEAMQLAVAEMGKDGSFRGYSPAFGYDFLRKSVADYYKNRGIATDACEIYISDGAKSDIADLGDILGANEVLLPSPVYPVYLDSALISGRRVRFLRGDESNSFLPTPENSPARAFERASEPTRRFSGNSTRISAPARVQNPKNLPLKPFVIYLCSPNNPTGAVYTREMLRKWVDFALAGGSLIIFDCAYEAYIRDAELPRSIFEIDGARDCAIEIGSFSKMAGFTGVRCGWTVIPHTLKAHDGTALHKLWERRQETRRNGVSYVSQRAAEAALSPDGLKQNREKIDYYMENARAIASFLRVHGVNFRGGDNAPYIWLKCPDGMTSWEFFDFLLSRAEVVGTPGVGFGEGISRRGLYGGNSAQGIRLGGANAYSAPAGEGYFRLTAFAARENTARAIERLNRVF
ncbi:MAG: aminotransferase class I/II-fold pyridoxal phosphate-dependent enzyme [Eubacteriales bacterium]